MPKKIFFTLICIALHSICKAQDLSQIGKAKLFSYSGGISANSVFYEGAAVRDPFTYVLSGNINFNISGLYNIPLSFTYSNQEFAYSRPFKFNRLSLNPSYKWISAHIGDVSMTFSPYTLSGHQFTGLGLDLTPKGPFKISAMYGRLIRPIEYDVEIPENTAAYERYGYGLKTSYEFNKAHIGLTFFKAEDDVNSLDVIIPAEVGITPKDNLVVSLEGSLKLFKNAQLNVEYATSVVTENTETENYNGGLGPLSFIFNEKLSTSYYNAFNANIMYAVGSGSIGAGYERIDPDYKTLGAYFFSNDLENITVNASQTIFDNKLGITVNAGLQRDNLDKTKKTDLKKFVSAINLNLAASERTNIVASYSNFQSFNNIRSQFDYINEITQYDNIDNLNFKQLSQNANLNVGYMLSKTETKQQNLNVNLSFQDVQDLQEEAFSETETTVNTTQLFNGSSGYTLTFPKKSLNLSGVFNTTLNQTTEANSFAYGPTLVVGKQFFEKQLRTTFSSSYNASFTESVKQNDILNFRFNAGYVFLKKHNLNLSLLSLFRNSAIGAKSKDLTATLGYSYSFSSGDWKLKFNKNDSSDKVGGLPIVTLRYRDVVYRGNAFEVLSQIEPLRTKDYPVFKQNELNLTKNDIILLKSEDPKILKDRIIDYLDEIYHFKDFKEDYENIIYNSVLLLKEEAKRIDIVVENKFVELLIKLKNSKYKGAALEEIEDKTGTPYKVYTSWYEKYIDQRQKFVGHRWMQEKIEDINDLNDYNKHKELNDFKPKHLNKAYQIYSESENDLNKVDQYLLIHLIEHYQELAKDRTDPTNYKLKYTN